MKTYVHHTESVLVLPGEFSFVHESESINTSTVTNLPSPYIHYKQHCCVFCVGNHAGNMGDMGEGKKTFSLYYQLPYIMYVRCTIDLLSMDYHETSVLVVSVT